MTKTHHKGNFLLLSTGFMCTHQDNNIIIIQHDVLLSGICLVEGSLCLSSHLNTCCNNEPKFSIFPFYKFHSDNASARLSKERYFIHIFDPKLNIK